MTFAEIVFGGMLAVIVLAWCISWVTERFRGGAN